MTEREAASPARATVEVWVRRVADVPGGLDLMDDHEVRTLSRLVAPQAALSYAAGHVLARRALAEVVGSPARALRLDRTCPACGQQHGPPVPLDFAGVHLSLSRVGSHVAVAVAQGLPVGVDVEVAAAADFVGFPAVGQHPAERDQPATPAQSAGPGRSREQEWGARHAHPGTRRRAVTWVRKEAALKSLGLGLRVDPARLLTPPSGAPVDLLRDGSWVTVRDLALPWPELAGAVAVAGRVDQLAIRMR